MYGSGRVVLQLFSFVTLPILTRTFTPSDYGVIETITSTIAVVGIFSSLALESASQRSYFDYREDQRSERRRVLSTAFWTMLVWSSLLALIVTAFSGPLSDLLFGTRDRQLLLALAAVALPIALATGFFQEILRLRHQAGRYVAISLFGASLSVALILILVVGFDQGIRGFYIAALSGALPTLALGYWLVPRSIGFGFDVRELRTMLAYGIPLLPVAASAWVMQLLDRFFILYLDSVKTLGLYAVGYRLANVLLLGVTALGIAWSPFILDLHQRDPLVERHVRAAALQWVVLGLSFGAVVLSVFASETLRLLTGSSFHGAYIVVGLLCGSVVALGLNSVTMTGISLRRQTRYFAKYALWTAVLNVGLNFALIPPFGIVGAAVATLLTYATLAALYYWRAQKVDPAPFDTRSILIVLLVAAVLIAIGNPINLESIWLSILVKLPIVCAFPILVWVFGCVDGDVAAQLRRPFRRRLRGKAA